VCVCAAVWGDVNLFVSDRMRILRVDFLDSKNVERERVRETIELRESVLGVYETYVATGKSQNV